MLSSVEIEDLHDVVTEGDLLFRGRIGGWGNMGAMLSDTDQRYGHVGVVTEGPAGWQVIHAAGDPMAADGRVKADDFSVFLSGSQFAGLYRLPLDGDAVNTFMAELRGHVEARTPFDRHYDLGTSDRLYCTELVWTAWRMAGGDEEAVETTSWRGKAVIALDDLQYGKGVKLVAEIGGDAEGASPVVKALAAGEGIR